MLAFSLRDAREVNRFNASQLCCGVLNRCLAALLRGSSLSKQTETYIQVSVF